MRNAGGRLVWVALMVTAACGGDLLGATPDAGSDVPIAPGADASSPPYDAGSADTSSHDAIAEQEPGADAPVCGAESWSTVFESALDGGAPLGWGWVFRRLPDFLDFVRNLAVIHETVDWQGNLLCPTQQIDTCTYDPTQQRTSPPDVYHSNALKEFTCPDGQSCVWTYYQPLNEWLLVSATRNPEGYQLVVEFNAGCSPNCACDAG